jgi:hypothetical protein
MTPFDLYLEAARRGLRLAPAGDKLAVSPKGHCPPDFADVLRQHKVELLAWLSQPKCPGWGAVPPPGLPLGTIPPRPTPESRERLINYLFRQGADHPSPLTAWLIQREQMYFEGPGRHWDCALHAYAAARDAAVWQLNRNEVAVWQLLELLTA